MKKSFYVLVFILIGIFALSSCNTSNSTSSVTPVVIENNLLIVEGKLIPANSLPISFLASGTVAQVLVKVGDTVQKNQVVAKLDSSPQLEEAVKRAQQNLLAANQAVAQLKTNGPFTLAKSQLAVIQLQDAVETAQKNFDNDSSDLNSAKLALAHAELDSAKESLKELNEQGVNTQQLMLAEAQVASAKASLANAETAITLLELKAPFTGTVVNLDVQEGQAVSAGQGLLTLADFSQWKLATDNLTETNVVNIEPSQKVKVIFDALPDLQFDGVVEEIKLQSEEKRGDVTYTVIIRMANSDPKLRWGMTASVEFER